MAFNGSPSHSRLNAQNVLHNPSHTESFTNRSEPGKRRNIYPDGVPRPSNFSYGVRSASSETAAETITRKMNRLEIEELEQKEAEVYRHPPIGRRFIFTFDSPQTRERSNPS